MRVRSWVFLAPSPFRFASEFSEAFVVAALPLSELSRILPAVVALIGLELLAVTRTALARIIACVLSVCFPPIGEFDGILLTILAIALVLAFGMACKARGVNAPLRTEATIAVTDETGAANNAPTRSAPVRRTRARIADRLAGARRAAYGAPRPSLAVPSAVALAPHA